MLSWASSAHIEPAHELFVNNLENIVSTVAVAHPRQYRLYLGFILVSVFLKTNSYRVVAKEQCGRRIE